jgi:hypothetical protein
MTLYEGWKVKNMLRFFPGYRDYPQPLASSI